MRKNEFGEELSESDLENYTKKIRALSHKDIDNLWHACGFIIVEREKGFNSINQKNVDSIRKDIDSAKEIVWNLICETPINEFRKELERIIST